MKVIAFTGMPGSGKSESVAVASALGIPIFRMGDFVWAEVKKRGLALEDANVGKVATEERKKHGYGIWAQRTVEKIHALDKKPEKLIIDGVRNSDEVKIFKEALGSDFTLVAIATLNEIRFERLRIRNRADEVASREEFEERDKREIGWGLDSVIKNADITVENDGPLEALKEKIRSILSER
jgi:dephospho-CoA kinase